MKKFKLVIWSTVVALCLLTGCTKDLSKDEGGKNPGDFFDFRTTDEQVVNVEYNVPAGYRVFFEAYAEYPVDTVNGTCVKKDLKSLFRGFVDDQGKYSEKVQLPTYVKEVYLYSENVGVPMVTPLNLSNGRSRSFSRADDVDYIYSKCATGFTVMGGGKWNAMGVPDYLGTKKDITANGLRMLNATLGDKDKYVSDYKAKSGEANLVVVKNDATIDMVIVHNSGNTIENTIGYYYYPTNNPPRTESDIQKIILLPNATFPERGSLLAGDNVRLKYLDKSTGTWSDKFPSGYTIGWFIVPGGYNKTNHEVMTADGWRMAGFSNIELDPAEKQHNIIVRDPLTKIRYIGFEDKNFGSKPEYRDFIFYIESDGVEYNDERIPDGKDMTDTDKDGIPDVDDEFPDDATRAYSIDYFGTLAFEDIWPQTGDYDMNDLVVEYNTKHYLNANNLVTGIKDQWTVKNAGAALESGFGYQFKMPSYKVNNAGAKITSTYTSSSRFPKDAKGLEVGQSTPTIVLFDNARDVMSSSEDARVFTVDITLSGATKVEEIGFPPYNPFIIVNTKEEGRGHEVHLPNYKPTDLMDTKLLHVGLDLSDPQKGIYFVSNSNYPFAICIPGESFTYPKEKIKIDVAYPEFSKWASSNGLESQDWYKHKK